MDIGSIKALTFDTGGTILDWHTGFSEALNKAGDKYSINEDWGKIANELRRRSLKKVLNLGENSIPTYNFDNAHRMALDEIILDYKLDRFTEEDRYDISYKAPHNFTTWDDFPAVLPELRKKFICVSFTLLSFRLIMDTAKKNKLSWDAIMSCEAIGKYKLLPEAYTTTAKWLQLEPTQCAMVACHNFDLDAAKKVGYKTIFIKRADEWGKEGPPDPIPNKHHDLILDSFSELKEALKC